MDLGWVTSTHTRTCATVLRRPFTPLKVIATERLGSPVAVRGSSTGALVSLPGSLLPRGSFWERGAWSEHPGKESPVEASSGRGGPPPVMSHRWLQVERASGPAPRPYPLCAFLLFRLFLSSYQRQPPHLFTQNRSINECLQHARDCTGWRGRVERTRKPLPQRPLARGRWHALGAPAVGGGGGV